MDRPDSRKIQLSTDREVNMMRLGNMNSNKVVVARNGAGKFVLQLRWLPLKTLDGIDVSLFLHYG